MRTTVRFRQRRQGIGRAAPQRFSPGAVMVLTSELKETGALDLCSSFQWPSLSRALGAAKNGTLGRVSFGEAWRVWEVTGVGYEGTPTGSDLVVHVQ